jgi:hypothetical protein
LTDPVICLCDREPLPSAPPGPLDIRNVRRAHLEAIAVRYPWVLLRIGHYLDTDLTPLARLTELQSLSIDWASKVTDLSPIGSLSRLAELYDITVLTQLPRIENLRLANMWPMEQFAVLSARFGPALELPAPLNDLRFGCPRCGASRVQLVGRGKPTLCPRCNAARVERELAKYESAVRAARPAP